jgi:hypothetical protein
VQLDQKIVTRGRTQIPAVLLLVVCNWGHLTYIGLGLRGSNLHEFRVLGQVGQESNLHPAVLEPRVRECMGVHAMSLSVGLVRSCRGCSRGQLILPDPRELLQIEDHPFLCLLVM